MKTPASKGIAFLHIHGYNTDDFRRTVGRFHQQCLEHGHVSQVLVYHADNARAARRKNPVTAERLNNRVQQLKNSGYRVVVMAHSNGNTILRMAYDQYKTDIDIAICVQPALPSGLNPFPSAQRVFVVWNPEDVIVKLGRRLTFVTRLISKRWAAQRNWGQMGFTGYIGSDSNVTNLNSLCDFVHGQASGHSGLFHDDDSDALLQELYQKAINEAFLITSKGD